MFSRIMVLNLSAQKGCGRVMRNSLSTNSGLMHGIYECTNPSQLTILSRSRVYTSLFNKYPCLRLPNRTALWSSTIVNENSEQGGGLVPVTGGDDNVPERGEGGIRYTTNQYYVIHFHCIQRGSTTLYQHMIIA